ncbi:MAG TPA: helix-turn-helix domain-containing protein [Acidobacteriaceae bacterium]|nr:helix-turn-helix domain-containing protein [Acidobacteriaceae bacterium]
MPLQPGSAHRRFRSGARSRALTRETNRLFGYLPDPDWRRWKEKLEFVELPRGLLLQDRNRPRSHVWFPATAVVSLVCVLAGGQSIHTAVIGNEGLVGMPPVLGAIANPTRAQVSAGGHGYRMSAAEMHAELRELPVLQILLRYAVALMTQISQGAVCRRRHVPEEQLCRWLLSHLKETGDEIRVTHEQLGRLLGFPRKILIEAVLKLQQAELIRASRGRIRVLDCAALELRCCECRSVIEREYQRLMGPAPH